MTDKVKALCDEARKLTVDERAELIEALIASLDEPDAGIDAAWAEEINRRVRAYKNGEAPAYPLEEVLGELRSRCG